VTIEEALAEIKRLQIQHEEMLLKHARDQAIMLNALESALEEIQVAKKLLRSVLPYLP